MPEMDGYGVVRAIRAEQGGGRGPTVVAFTANTHSEALERCLAAGMDDYLTKPTELGTLREKVSRWLGDAAALAMPPSKARTRAPRHDAIDRARMQQLVGGPDGMAGVLSEVEAGARDDIAALEGALHAGDDAALRAAAHRIKGSALTIGARGLAAAATRLEEAPGVASSVQALIEELKAVIAATRGDRNVANA